MLMPQQQCPRCDAQIFRENATVTKVKGKDRKDQFIYCQICGYGIEASIYDDGDIFTLDYIERTEPDNFAKFLNRLAAARAA